MRRCRRSASPCTARPHTTCPKLPRWRRPQYCEAQRPAPEPPIDLAGLGGSGDPPRAARRALIAALPDTPIAERARARLRLARHYLAEGLGGEASTNLAAITDADLAAAGDDTVDVARRGLGGAAQALRGRWHDAERLLMATGASADPELALWQGWVAAENGAGSPLPAPDERALAAFARYPMPLRARLGPALARTLVEAGDGERAQALLSELERDPLPPAAAARLSLVRGVAHARTGSAAEARAAFRRALETGDRPTRIDAAFADLEHRLAEGDVTPGQALVELQLQRQQWRGHPAAATMLDRLARLQAAAGKPVTALATWQSALAAPAPTPLRQQIDAARRHAFKVALADAERSPILGYALARSYPELLAPAEAQTMLPPVARGLVSLGLPQGAARLM